MRKLNRPTDHPGKEISPADVFSSCVSMVKDSDLRSKFLSVMQAVVSASSDYDEKAVSEELYLCTPQDAIGGIAKAEFIKIYTSRMVPKGATGRKVYDLIMQLPLNSRCPYCGIGTVNSIDHFLPKSIFPIYSVTPNNLVPACNWCQGEKSEYFSSTKGDQILHPYFDEFFDSAIWLVATVVNSAPATFRFVASPPDNWDGDKKQRVVSHLTRLNLPKLFSSNAGSRLVEIRQRLSDLLTKGGSSSVRDYLCEELNSFERECRNSWLTAMYRAAISDSWFCEGGFNA